LAEKSSTINEKDPALCGFMGAVPKLRQILAFFLIPLDFSDINMI